MIGCPWRDRAEPRVGDADFAATAGRNECRASGWHAAMQ